MRGGDAAAEGGAFSEEPPLAQVGRSSYSHCVIIEKKKKNGPLTLLLVSTHFTRHKNPNRIVRISYQFLTTLKKKKN